MIKQYMNPFPTQQEVVESEDSKKVFLKMIENTLELGVAKYERIYEKEPSFIELNSVVWNLISIESSCSCCYNRYFFSSIELKPSEDVPWNFIYFHH